MSRIGIMLLTMTLFSCSQLRYGAKTGESHGDAKQQADNAQLNPAQVKDLSEKSSQKLGQELKRLEIAVKASEEEKIRFLASDIFLKASAAQMEGDHKVANILFGRLVELNPDDAFVQKKYAISLIRAGELQKSLDILVKLHNLEAGPEIGLVLAGVYTSIGKVELARGVYQGILKNDPQHEDACIFLAKTHIMQSSFDKAQNTLKSCEKKSKGRGIFSYYIGKMHVDNDDLKKAKTYFKRASKLEPGFSQAIMALGLVYEEQGNKAKAVKLYKKYLKQKPNDNLILSRLVQLMFATEKFQEATKYAEKLSDLEPDDLNLKVKLGILYTDAKEYEKAISTFKELLIHAPQNDKILYYLGAIYQEIKQFENSVEYFSRVPAGSGLFQDSSLQAAQMLSSLALVDEKKYRARFLETIEKKAALIPEMKVEFHVLKAGFHENLEENDLAILAMEKVASQKNFTDNHRYYLASLYEKENDYDKVLPIVQGILKRNPNDAYAWNFLGYSLLEKGGDLQEAYKYISKAIELNPDDGYIRDSLGWYYYKLGDVDKALTELEKAAKLVPDDISIQKHLAVVYGKLRKFGKAKEFIHTAIGLAKFESERKELLEVLKDLDPERIPASALDE